MKEIGQNGRKHYDISAIGFGSSFCLDCFSFFITCPQAGVDSQRAMLHFYFPFPGYFIPIVRLNGVKSFRLDRVPVLSNASISLLVSSLPRILASIEGQKSVPEGI